MYALELVIVLVIATTVAGAVIGYFVGRKSSSSSQAKQALEEQVEQLQQQQQDYQNKVSDHFVETAQLFNQLTNTYKDVHTHLAKGAQHLAGDQANGSLKALSDDSTELIDVVDTNSSDDELADDEPSEDQTAGDNAALATNDEIEDNTDHSDLKAH